jgi:NAD(P)-dependent dehydrogenase (short-subunit alcohol dehydrogenase family)
MNPPPSPLLTLIGFGPGNGRGIAQAFASAGYRLALLARDADRARQLAATLDPRSPGTQVFAADAGRPESLRRALDAVAAECGVADVVIYNVMAPNFGRPTALTPESALSDFQANVLGALVSTQSVLPAMRAKRAGTILFTGGGWALQPAVDAASASLGKAALRSLAFTLSADLQGTGIRVGTLTILGAVQTGTPFAPDRIGAAFLRYATTRDPFPTEHVFDGS